MLIGLLLLAMILHDPGRGPRLGLLAADNSRSRSSAGSEAGDAPRAAAPGSDGVATNRATTTSSSVPAGDAGGLALEDSGVRLNTTGTLAWGDYDNDDDLDLAIVGRDANGQAVTSLYRNDGGVFTPVATGLPGMWSAGLAWGDFDNDGDVDLALAGQTNSGPVCRVFQNNGGTFTDLGAGLAGAVFSSVAWGDGDNDGQLDLVVGGSNQLRLYKNAQGLFTDLKVEIGGVQFASLAWGDFDNDGDFDLAVGGEYNAGASFGPVSRVLRNDGEGRFKAVDVGLPALSNAAVAWCDYDADGDLDLAIAGFDGDQAVSRIYRNDGSGGLSPLSVHLTGLGAGAVAWGDYDNDGDSDLVIAGFYNDVDLGPQCRTLLYRNDGEGRFMPVDLPLTGVHYASLGWGDYDGDGDLDLAVSGVTCGYEPVTRIYRNNCPKPNTQPEPPGNLSSTSADDSVTFSWTAGSDAETPVAGLHYHLRVGTRPGGQDVYSGMADADGLRRVPGWTGAPQRLSWTIHGLDSPPYYWSVQSIDSGFAGSEWAGEPATNWSRVHNTTKGTWHETIQAAIDEADDGDEVVVMPGIYSGAGNWELDFNHGLGGHQPREITLRSLTPTDPAVVAATVIDCKAIPSRWPRRAMQFVSGEGPGAVVRGLTFRNSSGPPFGDAMDGGGIYCHRSSPTIERCVFDNCSSVGSGGAIAVISPERWSALPRIRDCDFTRNRADAGAGALYLSGTGVTLEGCRFRGNAGGRGGAMQVETPVQLNVAVRNCLFDANHATQQGGAIYVGDDVILELTGCTLTNNTAAQAGGCYSAPDSLSTVMNCLFWGNRDTNGANLNAQLHGVESQNLSFSLLEGWTSAFGGTANSGHDPKLANINGPDSDPSTWEDNRLDLTPVSPAINAGRFGPYPGQADVRGEDRVRSCRADVGAYESPWSLPQADFNADCRVDVLDLRFFIMCSTGAEVPQTDEECKKANLDLDESGDVDADDFAIFQRCWSGEFDAVPSCAE